MRWLTPLLILSLAVPAWAQETDEDSQPGVEALEAVEKSARDKMVEKLRVPEPAVRPNLRTREEELFSEVLQVIEAEYYDTSVTRAELLEAAVQGMLQYLNTRNLHRLGTRGSNTLLSPTAHARLRSNLSGQISGIGVIARKEATTGAFEIVRVIDNSPGYKAGLHIGDRIVAINSLPVKQVGIQGAVQLLRGKSGTSVRLAILPHGEQAPENVQIVRGSFQVAQVTSQPLGACTGYIRLPNLGPGVSEATASALMQFGDNVSSVVLDLRDNPGGALEEAVGVANLFLDKGAPVVRLQTRDTNTVATTSDDPVFVAPVTVLVDGRTAGAAEVLASTLQVNRRAALVGARTAGRATAESIYGISTGAALRLSTAVYRDPVGRTWAGSGLTPLVEVAPTPFGPGDPLDPALTKAQELLISLQPCAVDAGGSRPASTR